ncbi:hypothetical protein DENSPDRAFT_887130 [Dentipellis sp. KUC8613]|nr:hypothetical protein DENSPDRAFT_887130 [Dentipellis sp. KUC8613]
MRPQPPLPALSSLARHLLHLVVPCHRPLHPLEPTAALVHLNAVVTGLNAARTRRTAALAPQRDPLVTTTTLLHLNTAVSRLNAAVSCTSSPSRTCHLPHPLHAALVRPLAPQRRPNAVLVPLTAALSPPPPSVPSPPPSVVRAPSAPSTTLCHPVRRPSPSCLPPAARRMLYLPPAPAARHLRLCAVCAPSARTLHVLQPPSPALSATSARATARRGCEGANGPTRPRGRDDAPMRARRGHGNEGATRAIRAVPALSATFTCRMSPPRTVRALCHPVHALRRLLVPSPPSPHLPPRSPPPPRVSATSMCLRRPPCPPHALLAPSTSSMCPLIPLCRSTRRPPPSPPSPPPLHALRAPSAALSALSSASSRPLRPPRAVHAVRRPLIPLRRLHTSSATTHHPCLSAASSHPTRCPPLSALSAVLHVPYGPSAAHSTLSTLSNASLRPTRRRRAVRAIRRPLHPLRPHATAALTRPPLPSLALSSCGGPLAHHARSVAALSRSLPPSCALPPPSHVPRRRRHAPAALSCPRAPSIASTAAVIGPAITVTHPGSPSHALSRPARAVSCPPPPLPSTQRCHFAPLGTLLTLAPRTPHSPPSRVPGLPLFVPSSHTHAPSHPTAASRACRHPHTPHSHLHAPQHLAGREKQKD